MGTGETFGGDYLVGVNQPNFNNNRLTMLTSENEVHDIFADEEMPRINMHFRDDETEESEVVSQKIIRVNGSINKES